MTVGSSEDRKKGYAKCGGHGIRMPVRFADMTGEEAEYGGGSWAIGLAAAGLSFIIGGGVCFGLNRIFGVGDRDTVTDIAIGGLIVGCCLVGVSFLIPSKSSMEKAVKTVNDEYTRIRSPYGLSLPPDPDNTVKWSSVKKSVRLTGVN